MSRRATDSPEPLYPRLSGRAAQAMGSERVAAHQRGRLLGAMVAAVDRHGYEAVRVAELVALAGVSKSSFYREFSGKEDCFLATFDEIVEQGAEQIEAAYRSATGVPERLTAASESFLDLATEQTPVARLVFLSSLGLGAGGVEARERATQRFERMLSPSLAEAAGGREPSSLDVRGVVGGAHEVVYRRLRDAKPERLREEIPELVTWALRYAPSEDEAPSPGRRLLAAVADDGGTERTEHDAESASWEKSPKSQLARRSLSQRERIMRAAAQVVAEKGFAALTVTAISTRAGVSNQTFYAEFASKEEAFLAAFDALALLAFRRTAAGFSPEAGWLKGGVAALGTLLAHFSASPLHRRIVFVELPTAGHAALGRAEAMLDIFIALLEPEELPPELERRPPRVVLEAIAGGIWAIVQREADAGRGDRLADLTPELIDFVLVAFGVREGK